MRADNSWNGRNSYSMYIGTYEKGLSNENARN